MSNENKKELFDKALKKAFDNGLIKDPSKGILIKAISFTEDID